MDASASWREPEAAIAEGVRLFNAGDYFQAHEVLEESWRTAAEPMKTFLKGLIHAAVALYQYARSNEVGARSKYESTHFYLEPYLPAFASIDVAGLLEQLDQFFGPFLDSPVPCWRSVDDPRPKIQYSGETSNR